MLSCLADDDDGDDNLPPPGAVRDIEEILEDLVGQALAEEIAEMCLGDEEEDVLEMICMFQKSLLNLVYCTPVQVHMFVVSWFMEMVGTTDTLTGEPTYLGWSI